MRSLTLVTSISRKATGGMICDLASLSRDFIVKIESGFWRGDDLNNRIIYYRSEESISN